MQVPARHGIRAPLRAVHERGSRVGLNPDRATDLFRTNAYWFGVNYYLKGYESRMQLNYIIVNDPVNDTRGLRNYKNNQLVFTYQVMF